MSSTPRCKGRGYLAYIMYFLSHFERLEGWKVGLLWEKALLYIVHLSQQFKEEEGQGFAGIIVDSCGLLC